MASSAFLRGCSTGFLQTRQWRFHYFHAGSGRPVVLIHGGGMWLYSFRHMFAPLSRTCSVFAPDMPGYGFTTALNDPQVMDTGTYGTAIREFMDCLALEKATLVGHSWGGGWSLACALQCPDRVDRIVLLDSSGLDAPDVMEWELLKIPFLGDILLGFLTPGMVLRRLRRSFHDTSLVDEAMAREVYLPYTIRSNRRTQARLSRNLSWKGIEARLPEIRQPVLLIWGDRDRYLDVAMTERFRSRIPHATVEILPGCGHSPHEEFPGRVVELINDFLADRR